MLCSQEILWRGHLKSVLSLFCGPSSVKCLCVIGYYCTGSNHSKICFGTPLFSSATTQQPSSTHSNCTSDLWWGQKRNCLVQKRPSTKKIQKPIKYGVYLAHSCLVADATPCQQTRVEVPPQPQLSQDFFKLFKKPKSCQFPTTSPSELAIQISISNCMAMLTCGRPSHFGS